MCLVCCLGIALVCVRACVIGTSRVGWDHTYGVPWLYSVRGTISPPPPDVLHNKREVSCGVDGFWVFFKAAYEERRSAQLRPGYDAALLCVCFHTEMNRRKERREKPSRLGLLLIGEGQCYNCYI